MFEVKFRGNGGVKPKVASDYALLRAAEVSLEHNFPYFSILGERAETKTDYANMGSNSYTTGNITNYGGGYSSFSGTTTTTTSTIPIVKPTKIVRIRCYASPPGGHAGKVYRASDVRSELRTKYKIDAKS